MAGQRVVVVDGKPQIFPEDATDAEISAALNAPPVQARGPKPARTWTDVAVDALPAAGGLLGGVVGGIGGTAFGLGIGGAPGAIGGATLGGGAGEAFKQLINRARGADAPATSLDAATEIGKRGGIEGASEAAGLGVMKAGKMAAHGLMDFAIRPAPTVAEEFGDIAGTAIKERLPVGSIFPGGRTGTSLAREAMRESAGTTRGLLKEAGDAGLRVSPADIARGPVSNMVGEIAKQPLHESELNQVSRMFAEFLDSHPSDLRPAAVKDLKQAAQRIAKPIFKALNAGNVPPAGEALKAQFNKAIADGSKEALESLPDIGKAVASSEGRTQSLIGATKAIRRAEVRRMPLVAELAAPLVGASVGGGVGGPKGAGEGLAASLLTRALLSPRTTSRAALGLTNPLIQQALRQMPRAAVYSLLQQITGTDPAGADPSSGAPAQTPP
jgi:hypothetical protein